MYFFNIVNFLEARGVLDRDTHPLTVNRAHFLFTRDRGAAQTENDYAPVIAASINRAQSLWSEFSNARATVGEGDVFDTLDRLLQSKTDWRNVIRGVDALAAVLPKRNSE